MQLRSSRECNSLLLQPLIELQTKLVDVFNRLQLSSKTAVRALSVDELMVVRLCKDNANSKLHEDLKTKAQKLGYVLALPEYSVLPEGHESSSRPLAARRPVESDSSNDENRQEVEDVDSTTPAARVLHTTSIATLMCAWLVAATR